MPDLTGVIFSEYLLLDCIGRGSSADVYRARRHEGGTDEVAIKVFHREYAEDEKMRACFLREAEQVGLLDHPHILPVIEYGEHAGLLYVVIPLINNGTLNDLLKQVGGKFSLLQTLPLVQQLCGAVYYAHECDVIHGNIKPDNIFLTDDGRLLLADFGLVRHGQHFLKQLEWGAVQYAAPEQSLGLRRRAGDIYSLGAVFFRLLTGSPVFVGQTPVEVLLKHVRHVPPSAESLDTRIPRTVDAVLQKALSKRGDERYTTALELSQAFTAATAGVSLEPARWLNTTPLVAAPQTPVPASLLSLEAQKTAPLRPVPVLPVPPVGQTSVISLPLALLQQSQPYSPVLPEQHGLSELTSVESIIPAVRRPVISAPLTPVEWSEMAGIVGKESAVSVRSASAQISRAEEEASHSQHGRLLPILVVLLLLLGLLAALLSSFFLPSSTSHGTGMRVLPTAVAVQIEAFSHHSS